MTPFLALWDGGSQLMAMDVEVSASNWMFSGGVEGAAVLNTK